MTRNFLFVQQSYKLHLQFTLSTLHFYNLHITYYKTQLTVYTYILHLTGIQNYIFYIHTLCLRYCTPGCQYKSLPCRLKSSDQGKVKCKATCKNKATNKIHQNIQKPKHTTHNQYQEFTKYLKSLLPKTSQTQIAAFKAIHNHNILGPPKTKYFQQVTYTYF